MAIDVASDIRGFGVTSLLAIQKNKKTSISLANEIATNSTPREVDDKGKTSMSAIIVWPTIIV